MCIRDRVSTQSTWDNAVYLENGEQVKVPKERVLYHTFEREVNMSLNLEGYANRDSLKYIKTYNLQDAATVIRGTLRYKGFCEIVRAFIELGLLESQKVSLEAAEISFAELIDTLLQEGLPNPHNISVELITPILDDQGLVSYGEKAVKILKKVFGNAEYANLEQTQLLKISKRILKTMKFIDAFDTSAQKLKNGGRTILEIFCDHLQKKLVYKPGEKDAVYMQHIFKVLYPNGKKKTITSTLIRFGTEKRSAMATLVGTPTAIATQLVLDGVITKTGVIMPDSREIYEPVLQKLAEVGIVLQEETD
eukprot:TRINITY_DN9713_c0_g1_i2.p1 TRINITY_DN9713_c0_g1~~TRINITY_DN9713_c0_g1_i2.p1  ORF type:complete len:327 (-),score=98.32 TRINITY_DN9713_c0_g1_i2:118-1038(-)